MRRGSKMESVATFPFADRIALYDLLVATQPEVERRGLTTPYTSVNGNMFSYLNAAGEVALRLSPTDRAEFMERYGAAPAVAHGVTQAEYVAVPRALLTKIDELAPYFAASYEYAKTLKPKATTRPKKEKG